MNKKQKIFDFAFKITLVIIIIFLLIHNCKLMKNKKNPIPSGNVDILEIKCDNEEKCKVEPTNGDSIESNDMLSENENKKNESVSNSTRDEITFLPEPEELSVTDENIKWDGMKDIKIFSNSMYELSDRIAPECSNIYKFVVKNSTKYNLKYTINFIENNPYKVNMKYKLKKNDAYLIDNYVSADKLDISDFILNSNNDDIFYLEWKWFSSSNDTEIGMTDDAFYGLKIEIKAESINE